MEKLIKGKEKTAPRHSTVVAIKDNSLNFALNKIQTALNAASDERHQHLQEWERLAHKWEAEGDTHGMNFHQGMAAGANYVDIFYRRVGREVDAIRKEQATESSEASHNNNFSPRSPASQPNSEVSNIQSTLAEIRERHKIMLAAQVSNYSITTDKVSTLLSIIDSLQAEKDDLDNRSHQTVLFPYGCMFQQEGLDAEPQLIAHCADNAASNMKAELIKRVKNYSTNHAASDYWKQKAAYGISAADVAGAVQTTLQRLATELEAIELDQDQKVVK